MSSTGRFVRRPLAVVLTAALAALAACAAPAEQEANDSSEQHWDSADGNPTHPTHSIMAEFAVKQLAAELPEVVKYKKSIVDGANLELHDLPHKTHDALRLEIGGNNWAAEHPELLWQKAGASYASGDKAQAFFYVGILLHYVQDMGVPAHAFHVIHQSGPRDWDHTELLAFFDFHGDLRAPGPRDPMLADPVSYIEWSAQSSRDHFNTAFPGKTYHRKFLPQSYDALTDEQWAFLRGREAHCAHATAFALRSAAAALAATTGG
jgi:hypothetical protein